MIYPMYHDVLFAIQMGLGNAITPDLRAVTGEVDKDNDIKLFRFYYDREITWELEEFVDFALDDVDAGNELIQLNANKPIPTHDKLVYLRYEEPLPKFERVNHLFLRDEKGYPHQAIFRLDIQQALLGRVTPMLRNVSVDADPNTKKLKISFIYDGEISELNRQLTAAAIADSKVSFPDYEMESLVERIDYPNDFTPRFEWLAYYRHEWICKDNEIIYTIPKP